MQKIIARIISYIFHPILIPLVGTYFLFNSGTYLEYVSPVLQRYIYIMLFLCSVFIPLMVILLAYLLQVISSFEMEKHKERVVPLLISAISIYFAYHLIAEYQHAIKPVVAYLFASAISLVLLAIISVKWKISIHLAGIGGFLGLVFIQSFFFNKNYIFLLQTILLIAGLLGFSRLTLKAHDSKQLLAGFLLGGMVVLLTSVFM